MIRIKAFVVAGLLIFHFQIPAQTIVANKSTHMKIRHISKDFSVGDLGNAQWKKSDEITVDKYWSGETAPQNRWFKARLLWSDVALYVRFRASQSEPVIVSDKANLTGKTLKLWDRDVCEIFIAPDKNEGRKYFEFEIAPNGEWIDLAIDLTSGERKTDWDYISEMRSAAKAEKDKVIMAIKVEWKAFGKTPKAGDVWLGNLFRCVGKDPDRGYLAWLPTMTETPNFHVPEKFGEFVFVK